MYENGTFKAGLSDRALETFEAEFSGQTHTNWAKRSLFAIENNYDLGLAAKVNMIFTWRWKYEYLCDKWATSFFRLLYTR